MIHPPKLQRRAFYIYHYIYHRLILPIKRRVFLPLIFFLYFSLFSTPLQCQAQLPKNLLEANLQEGLTVDLRDPFYEDGVLSTDKGGVIEASQIRIQATHLRYTRKAADQKPLWTVEAEGNLIVEFGEYIFVGEKLFYDFEAKSGVIDQAKTAVEPWFFGGEQLQLLPDGSYVIHHGYVTTSERDVPNWGIFSKTVAVENGKFLKARDVSFKVKNYTILWIPSFKANLDFIFDNPIRFRFRWGGRQGPRFGLTYEIFSWEHWKTFLRFDYRLTRGPGGGIETIYRSPDRKTEFQSINYLAKDTSILHPYRKGIYRFEGYFRKLMDEDKTSILFTYDKISDRDTPSIYYDRDFDFDTAERTQLLMRREEEAWISNFYARVRINSFQTVKQELPTLDVHFKPFLLPQTGVIFDNRASASYLNFEYSKYLFHVHNYSSTRFEYFPSLYYPVICGPFCTLTPEIGMTMIFYGDSPSRESQYVALGKAGIDFRSQLYRIYGPVKHVIEPYASYRYFSPPTSSPDQHYIFDITDGWTRLNYLSFGINNAFFSKGEEGSSSHLLSADIYTFAFFDTDKIKQTIPKIYGSLSFCSLPTLKHTLHTAWNLEHNEVDYFNFRTEWTLNADFAISAEYRHRGSYWWRKVDHENFFLDMFHSEERLRHSALSDRRDTILVHFFYRPHPNWACELTTRQGWNRRFEPKYLEFEIDVLTTIQTAWQLRFSYQHQENDDRIVMCLNVGLRRPSIEDKTKKIPCFNW